MHEKWIDSASGYNCKIVQFADDRFKAIATSPDGKHEFSIERRNRYIAKRQLVLAIPKTRKRAPASSHQEIKSETIKTVNSAELELEKKIPITENKKVGKSRRAKKRKERKLRAKERNAEKLRDQEKDHCKIPPIDNFQIDSESQLNNLEEEGFKSASGTEKEDKDAYTPISGVVFGVAVAVENAISEKLEDLNSRLQFTKIVRLYSPMRNMVNLENTFVFELKGNYYHQKPTSNDILLCAEPSNVYDRNAIRVLDGNHLMIGYVPKEVVKSSRNYRVLTEHLEKASLTIRNGRLYVKAHIKTESDDILLKEINNDLENSPDNKFKNSNLIFTGTNNRLIFTGTNNSIRLFEDGRLVFKGEKGEGRSKLISKSSLDYFSSHCKNLTNEQKSVVLLACTGETFKVNAFAGTGKTTTILHAAEAFASNNKCYLAFNSSIAKEVKDLSIPGLQSYTIHQYARNQIIKKDSRYSEKLRAPGVIYHWDSQFLQSASKKFGVDIKEIVICLTIIRDFSTSTNNLIILNRNSWEEIKKWLADQISSTGDSGVKISHMSTILLEQCKEVFVNLATSLWNYIVDPDNKDVQISFEIYLKFWAMDPIHNDEDIFFIDESQDIDPVMFSALNKIKKQKIWVGDSYQQIYRWRGAINAMMEINGQALYLTQTFRFSQEICDLANFCLNKLGESKKLITFKKCMDTVIVDQTRTILFRTNIKMYETAFSYAELGNKIFFPSYKSVDFLWPLKILCTNLIFLKNGKSFKDNRLLKYKDFNHLKASINNEDVDQDLVHAYKLTEKFLWNIDIVNAKFKNLETAMCKSPDSATVLMCTAHSAKGREWEYVEVAEDFEFFLKTSKDSNLGDFRDELMLFYVAITRAKRSIVNIKDVEKVLVNVFSCSVDEFRN